MYVGEFTIFILGSNFAMSLVKAKNYCMAGNLCGVLIFVILVVDSAVTKNFHQRKLN